MPQMMPLNWMMLMLFFSTLIYIMMTIFFFFYLSSINNLMKFNLMNKFNLSW